LSEPLHPHRPQPRTGDVDPAAAQTIVFAHANGFGAGTYELLFDAWRAAGYTVQAPARLGHDPRFPVASNWRGLRDELLAFIDAEVPAPPVWLIGHSLGGLLCLLAASRRPELVRGLVILDSPVITGWRAHSVHMLKKSGLMARVSPGKVARRRRHHWSDRAAVLRHFAGKPVFARWDTRVLADYVASGFEDLEGGGGVELGFRREIETRIYDTLPHDIGLRLKKHPLQCPAAAILGTQSAEMRQGGTAGIRALVGERLVWIEGTHLYPMEKPEATAQAVLGLLAQMVGTPYDRRGAEPASL